MTKKEKEELKEVCRKEALKAWRRIAKVRLADDLATIREYLEMLDCPMDGEIGEIDNLEEHMVLFEGEVGEMVAMGWAKEILKPNVELEYKAWRA